MKPSIVCLSESDIPLLLSGNLPPGEAAAAESHLQKCELCRSKIESMIADSRWWDEAQESLANGSLRNADCSLATDDTEPSSNEQLLDLLGPTDDPAMLGRIGTYEIVGILGRGGMGAVFKGYDAALNRFVALKMLLPHLAASGAARKRFAREAQAAAAVVDDHVMAIHGVSEWNSIPYFVMPYSRGISLQVRLRQEGPLELREMLRIGLQVARGLAAAHSQGLVHRDIKPANIFLDEGVERVQLMDFGLARAVDDASMTRTGVVAGTPQYMSPEQARAEKIDPRSDLFSLGSVLYAMCAGHAPFRAESSYSVLRLITDKEPRPIREVNSDIPEWLCAIIGKLMSKRPDDRFYSAGQVAELFESCLAHVQEPTTTPLPAPVAELAKSTIARDESSNPTRSRGGFYRPPIRRLIIVAAFAIPLLIAGVFITLEIGKGTITIESDADGVPIVIKRSGKVYDKLTVDRDGESIRVFKGDYEIAIANETQQMTIENGSIILSWGDEAVVRIRDARSNVTNLAASEKTEVDRSPFGLLGAWELIEVNGEPVEKIEKLMSVSPKWLKFDLDTMQWSDDEGGKPTSVYSYDIDGKGLVYFEVTDQETIDRQIRTQQVPTHRSRTVPVSVCEWSIADNGELTLNYGSIGIVKEMKYQQVAERSLQTADVSKQSAAEHGLALNRDVHLILKGELAHRYLRMLNRQPTDLAESHESLVELTAKITETLSGNQYRIQHFSRQNIKGKPEHYVALEAIIGQEDFEFQGFSVAPVALLDSRCESAFEQGSTLHVTLSGLENYSIRAAFRGNHQAVSQHFQLGDGTTSMKMSLLEQSQIINGAESIWRKVLTQWEIDETEVIGQRIQLSVDINNQRPSGSSSWSFDGGMSNPTIIAAGSIDEVLADILPRQITHIVLARSLGQPLPRWIEMGTGTLAQSVATRKNYWSKLEDLHEADLLFPLKTLCSLKEYPSNSEQWKRVYIQSMAFCEFLIATQGRKHLLQLATESTDVFLASAIDRQFREWLTARTANSESKNSSSKGTESNLTLDSGRPSVTAHVNANKSHARGVGKVIALIRREQPESAGSLTSDLPKRAVELRISGDDIPLVERGDHVRLQFEGWPAIEFADSFGGEVMTIDPVADNAGKFRVLVKADGNDSWPDERYLRPGVRADGWIFTGSGSHNVALLPSTSPSQLIIDAPSDFTGGMVDIRATTNYGMIGQVIESKLQPIESGRVQAIIDLANLDDGYYSSLVSRADGTYEIHWFQIERPSSLSPSVEPQEAAGTSSPARPTPFWQSISDPGLRLVGFWEVQRELSTKPSEGGRIRHVVEKGIAEFKKTGSRFRGTVGFEGDDSQQWYQYVLLPREDWNSLQLTSGDLGLMASCRFFEEDDAVVFNFNDSVLEVPPSTRRNVEVDRWRLKRLTRQEYMDRHEQHFQEAEKPNGSGPTNEYPAYTDAFQPAEREQGSIQPIPPYR